jgi:adenosine deaminase
MHLEGSLEPSLLFELAKKNGITLPQDDDAFLSEQSLLSRYRRFASLDDFLGYYFIGISVLIQAADFEALAYNYFCRAATDGVKHAEVFFDPQAHLSRGVAYSTLLKGFLAAKQRAEENLGISVELILCFLRHLPVPDSLAVIVHPDVLQSFSDGNVIAIGMDSSEVPFPPELFVPLFHKAKSLGLRRTAHAGEEGPAAYIESALDRLEVQRIDHGLNLSHDKALMKRVAQDGIMLTLCPNSNLFLKCVKSIKEIPIREFLDTGVKFSINSDDPAYFGAYILDNYCLVQEAFELEPKDWDIICRNSMESSWCSQDRKSELLALLDKCLSEWTAQA